jgi:hypothetical protein
VETDARKGGARGSRRTLGSTFAVSGANYQSEAVKVLEDRLNRLRLLSHADARALAEADSEDIVIAGAKASVTVFRQDDAYQLQGRTLVTLLVLRRWWFGLHTHHMTRGLVFSPDEATREATNLELQNS